MVIINHFGSWWVVALWSGEFLSDTVWPVESVSSESGLAFSNVFLGAGSSFFVALGPGSANISRGGLADTVGLNLSSQRDTAESGSLLDRRVARAPAPLLPLLPRRGLDRVGDTSEGEAALSCLLDHGVGTDALLLVLAAQELGALRLVDLLVDDWAEADSPAAVLLADFDTRLPVGPLAPAIARTGVSALVDQTGQHTY